MADPVNTGVSQAAASLMIDRANDAQTVASPYEKAGILETAKAFAIENAIGFSLAETSAATVAENTYAQSDLSFNPYTFFRENQDQYSDVASYVLSGDFETVRNPMQFAVRADRFRQQLARQDILKRGDGFGYALGFGASILDVSTLVPTLGGFSKAKTLKDLMGNVGKGAAIGGAYAAADEAALATIQPHRGFDDVGTAAVFGGALGGGLGMLVSFRKGSDWHPESENHPLLRPEDAPTRSFRPGDDVEGAHVFDTPPAPNKILTDAEVEAHINKLRDDVSQPRKAFTFDLDEGPTPAAKAGDDLSVGAAQTSRADDVTLVNETQKGSRARAIASKLYNWTTPAGRLPRALSEHARVIAQKLMDMPGIVTKAQMRGKAREVPAEVLAEQFARRFHVERQKFQEEFHALNQRLEALEGVAEQSKLKRGAKSAVAYTVNFGREALGKPSNFKTNMLERHELNQMLVKAMHDRLTDTDIASNLRNPTREAVEEVRSSLNRVVADQRKMQADYEKLLLDKGLIKPEDALGDDFRMPHIWNGRIIRGKTAEFRAWLMDKLAKRPTEDYLQETWGITEEVFNKLGKEPVSVPALVNGKPGTEALELTAQTGLLHKQKILNDWQGGVEERALYEAQQALQAATVRYDQAMVDLRTLLADIGKVDTAKNATKLKEVQAELRKARWAADQRRDLTPTYSEKMLKAAEAALESAQTAKAELKVRRKQLQEQRDLLKKEGVGAAKKDIRKAERAIKKLSSRPPLEVAVEEISNKLAKNQDLPTTLIDDADTVTGRLKRRTLNLKPEDALDAMQRGFLRDDYWAVSERSYREIGGYAALQEKFGSTSLADEVKSIHDEYLAIETKWIEEGRSPKEIADLRNERDRTVEDIRALRDRLKGVYGSPQSLDDPVVWTLDRLREYNFVIHGAGFTISSLTDLASAALHSIGGNKIFSRQYINEVKQIFSDASPNEIRKLVYALELNMHHSRTAAMANVEDYSASLGLGIPGTRTQKITSMAERALKGMSDSMGVVSGMLAWNTRWKAMAMVEMQDQLVRNIDHFASVMQHGPKTPQEKTLVEKLTGIGLGIDELQVIQKQIHKHPPTGDLVKSLAHERWIGDPEGERAYNLVNSVLVRHAQRVINTPGIGDTPLLMSKTFGKTLFQFQTYSFTFINRYISPLVHRAIDFKDADMAVNFGILSMMAATTIMLKDFIRGKDPTNRSADEWVYDIADRSGLFGYMSPYVGLFGQAALGHHTSRYYGNTFGNQILGPTFSTFTNIGDIGLTTADPDKDITWNQMRRLLPYKPFLDIAVQAGDLATP